MSPSVVPSKVSDFFVLPLSLPSHKAYPRPSTHYIYLRADEPKVPGPKTPRTLFLANIPFDTTETHLKLLFSTQLDLPAGRIEEVEYHDQPRKTVSQGPIVPKLPNSNKKVNKRKRGAEDEEESVPELRGAWPETWDRELHRMGSTASVVFVDKTSLDAVVKAARKAKKVEKNIVWGQGIEGKVPSLGSQRYMEHLKRIYPPHEEILKNVNDYMSVYAARESARAKALARQRAEPDADGFVTVTKGGRVGAARQEEALERLEKQKEKQQGFNDFYRFQSREKLKERANDLLKKFEEDKEKVKRMKEQRRSFRPE